MRRIRVLGNSSVFCTSDYFKDKGGETISMVELRKIEKSACHEASDRLLNRVILKSVTAETHVIAVGQTIPCD